MGEVYVVGAVTGSEGLVALDSGMRLAQRTDGSLVVVHVEHFPSLAVAGEAVVSVERAVLDAVEEAERAVEREVRRRLSTSGLNWSFEVARGDAAAELIQAAVAHKATAIIVGGKTHTVLSGLLLGSTAEKLVRRSPVSVIVARAQSSSGGMSPAPGASDQVQALQDVSVRLWAMSRDLGSADLDPAGLCEDAQELEVVARHIRVLLGSCQRPTNREESA